MQPRAARIIVMKTKFAGIGGAVTGFFDEGEFLLLKHSFCSDFRSFQMIDASRRIEFGPGR